MAVGNMSRGILVKRASQIQERVFGQHVVGVQEQDGPAFGVGEPEVACPGELQVLGSPEVAESGVLLRSDNGDRIVRARIVNDEALPVLETLRRHRSQAVTKIASEIVSRDNDGNLNRLRIP